MQKISNIHFANIHQAGGILASCSNKYWGLQLYYENEAERESDIILEFGTCWRQEAATAYAKPRSTRFEFYIIRDFFLGK